ncbi:hypothetical protein CAS74_001493 [Pichia kudriavzevii]|uniref:PDZ GRASP-type domain-containing protein n=1 Tax=Pichia kudriavzevii TaxID=4909 RepID=A0A1Z8JRJ2_PICKU|nr:uncharacterized protein C5L36_0A02910 [Pichia kudriavzevii]AWU73689.1 hypothetical protein C5L36_0A02910 [Pichia kudriavzevii]OUT23181.1 hypothetical protein CAS74_001493 [Pichia kudriavzevii]
MFGFAKKLVSTIESQLSNESIIHQNAEIDESRQGLRILSVKPDSIGAKCGFESWFDFILRMNGNDINAYLQINHQTGSVNYENFFGYIRHEVEVANNNITFTVFSSKGSIIRDVVVTPQEVKDAISRSLNSFNEISLDENQASENALPWSPNLGISFQLTPIKAGFYTWHVLKVHPKSPAYISGIYPGEYILQAQDGLLATGGEDLLSKVLQGQYAKNGDGCELLLYVYNYDSDSVRPVTVVLRSGTIWGGRGVLGCDIGYGLLHRIPEVFGKFESTLEAKDVLAQDNVVNGNIVPEVPLTQPPEFLPRKVTAPNFVSEGEGDSIEQAARTAFASRKRNLNKHAAVNLEAYFDEQTKLNDNNSTAKTSENSSAHTGLPPPPPPPPKKV